MTDAERFELEEESESLPIHVKVCAIRHSHVMADIKSVKDELKGQRALLTSIRNGVWGAALALAGTAGSIYATGVVVMRSLSGH